MCAQGTGQALHNSAARCVPLTPAFSTQVRSVLTPDGRLCAEAAGCDAAAAKAALEAAGWRVDAVDAGPAGRLRVVAQVV